MKFTTVFCFGDYFLLSNSSYTNSELTLCSPAHMAAGVNKLHFPIAKQ